MKKALSLLLALVMCLSLIACSSEKEAEQIEAIESECISIFDSKIESFLSTYDEYNATNVKYQIVDISKQKGFTDEIYVISLMVHAICDDDNLSKVDRSLIAYDVLEIFDMNSGNQFYLAGTWCSYRPLLDDSNTYYDDRITIYVNGSYAMGPEDFALPETSKEKCRNCGRTEDIIPGFGMCESCFEGFVDWQEDYYED
jgi:hypothetical protein